MTNILVVAPHPDDETLGCGGTLLKHKSQGDSIHWLIITSMSKELGFSQEKIKARAEEIKKVSEKFGFSSVSNLELPPAYLDTFAMADIVKKIGSIFNRIQPHTVYLPYRGDVHSDHKIVFDATMSCTKWFRYNFVKKILVYETLSETEFSVNPDFNGFHPNVFVNIDNYLEEKIDIFNIYKSEISEFPFPRSEKNIRSLAFFRGASSGFKSAEAFMLIRELI